MNTRIIDTADAVVRRYKTRNPEEIISQRAIKLKDIRFCHDLLGYYTVLLNCEYIGINPNCTAAQRSSSAKPISAKYMSLSGRKKYAEKQKKKE